MIEIYALQTLRFYRVGDDGRVIETGGRTDQRAFAEMQERRSGYRELAADQPYPALGDDAPGMISLE